MRAALGIALLACVAAATLAGTRGGHAEQKALTSLTEGSRSAKGKGDGSASGSAAASAAAGEDPKWL